MMRAETVSRSFRRVRTRLGWLAATAALACVGARPTAAADVTAATLKAAFLYNFAKFAEWPAEALSAGQRLSLCVIGDHAVADALGEIISGRAIEGHELVVAIVKPDGPLRSCHLLYVGGLGARETPPLLETLNGSPVFTVGDGEKFAESGGVAQLILENDRMRFAINVAAARRARLRLSSRLLSLAQIVQG